MQSFENSYLRIETNNSSKKCFLKKIFSIFFVNGSNFFLTIGKNPTERLSEMFSTCSKTCWRNRFFQFHSLLVVLSVFEQNFSDIWPNIFHKAVKTVFYVFRRKLWWKKKIFENCFLVEIWANFFLTFGKKYSAKLAELLCRRSDEHFDVRPTSSLKSSSSLFGFWSKLFLNFRILFFCKVWKLFSKNWYEHFNRKNLFWKILKFFRNQIETFSDIQQKIHGEIVRHVFYVFKNMLKKQTFSILFSFRCAIGLWAKLFWHVAQNFPQSCQIWFLRVQTTILMKKEVFWKLSFFVIWAIFFLTFVKKYSATLAEGPSKRLDEQFDVQQFLLKNCSFFGFWSKLFLNFWILFFCKIQKSVF